MFNKNQRFHLSPRLRIGVGRKNTQNQILKYTSAIFILVASFLTINTLRLILKSPQNTNPPQVLGVQTTKPEQEETKQFTTYSVKKGDTLYSIAQNLNISWTILATLNQLESPFLVNPGDTLKVPSN